jgi:hypothetical protein
MKRNQGSLCSISRRFLKNGLVLNNVVTYELGCNIFCYDLRQKVRNPSGLCRIIYFLNDAMLIEFFVKNVLYIKVSLLSASGQSKW